MFYDNLYIQKFRIESELLKKIMPWKNIRYHLNHGFYFGAYSRNVKNIYKIWIKPGNFFDSRNLMVVRIFNILYKDKLKHKNHKNVKNYYFEVKLELVYNIIPELFDKEARIS